MEDAPRSGQRVYLAAMVAEVHNADSEVTSYHTAMVRLRDGQAVMTHWSNLQGQSELVDEMMPLVLEARPDLTPVRDLDKAIAPPADESTSSATDEPPSEALAHSDAVELSPVIEPAQFEARTGPEAEANGQTPPPAPATVAPPAETVSAPPPAAPAQP